MSFNVSFRTSGKMVCLAPLLFLGAVATAGCSSFQVTAEPPRVSDLQPAGELKTPARADGRDAGSSVVMGAKIAWLFGDTFPDEDTLLTATAAWSEISAPYTLTEPVGEGNIPFELFCYSVDEQQYNLEHASPPECCKQQQDCSLREKYCACERGTDCGYRIALWPGDAVKLDEDTLLMVYEIIRAGVAPYDFEFVGNGIATLDLNQSVATRVTDEAGRPLILFGADSHNYLHMSDGRDGYVYFYARKLKQNCLADIYIARVPTEAARQRDQYEFWAAGGWIHKESESMPMLRDIVGGLGSVLWNPWLRRFVAAELDLCTGANLALRTAPRPEGPWTDARSIDVSSLGATGESYAARLHEALSEDDRVGFSFYVPKVTDDKVVGRLHFGSVRLRGAEFRRGRGRYWRAF